MFLMELRRGVFRLSVGGGGSEGSRGFDFVVVFVSDIDLALFIQSSQQMIFFLSHLLIIGTDISISFDFLRVVCGNKLPRFFF